MANEKKSKTLGSKLKLPPTTRQPDPESESSSDSDESEMGEEEEIAENDEEMVENEEEDQVDEDDVELSDSDSESEEDESQEEEQESIENGIHSDWPKADDLELIERVRQACPTNDTMHFPSRLKNIDWDSVKFLNYSAEECKERCLFMIEHLRHYRTMSEVLDDGILWANQPWTNFNKRGKNNQKHPELPKKPKTSFLLYYLERVDALIKKKPGLDATKLSKEISQGYNALSPKQRSKYLEMATKEKNEYLEKMAKFLADHPGFIPITNNNNNNTKKPTKKSKRPTIPTPLKLFTDASIHKYAKEGVSKFQARNQCHKEYNNLTDKQKLKWIYLALDQEHKYLEAVKQFQAEYPDVVVDQAKKRKILSKNELRIKQESEGKPIKPPNSGYTLFSRKMLLGDKLKDFTSKDKMTEIARRWKNLKDEKKKYYNDKALKMTESYKLKYLAYLNSLTPGRRNEETLQALQAKNKKAKKQNGNNADKPEVKDSQKKIPVSTSDPNTASDDDFETPTKPIKNKINGMSAKKQKGEKESPVASTSNAENGKSKKRPIVGAPSNSKKRSKGERKVANSSDE